MAPPSSVTWPDAKQWWGRGSKQFMFSLRLVIIDPQPIILWNEKKNRSQESKNVMHLSGYAATLRKNGTWKSSTCYNVVKCNTILGGRECDPKPSFLSFLRNEKANKRTSKEYYIRVHMIIHIQPPEGIWNAIPFFARASPKPPPFSFSRNIRDQEVVLPLHWQILFKIYNTLAVWIRTCPQNGGHCFCPTNTLAPQLFY